MTRRPYRERHIRLSPSRLLRKGVEQKTEPAAPWKQFFHDGNWRFQAGIFAMAFLALLCAVIALIVSIALTSWSAEVATDISVNERRNAADQRCVDSLIVLRGSLSELTAGYSLRPLDRDSRLLDWGKAKQSLDAVSLACSSEVIGESAVARHYALLLADFEDEYLRAPSGGVGRLRSDAVARVRRHPHAECPGHRREQRTAARSHRLRADLRGLIGVVARRGQLRSAKRPITCAPISTCVNTTRKEPSASM